MNPWIIIGFVLFSYSMFANRLKGTLAFHTCINTPAQNKFLSISGLEWVRCMSVGKSFLFGLIPEMRASVSLPVCVSTKGITVYMHTILAKNRFFSGDGIDIPTYF